MIITTHYIEEMRQANTVKRLSIVSVIEFSTNILRNGVLMTEESPARLLEINNATMLEDVVLKYCLKEDIPQIETECNLQTADEYDPAMYKQDENTKSSQTHSVHRVTALTVKNLIVILRNIG